MKRDTSVMCTRAAEPILSDSWESLKPSDPVRSHISTCLECQSRIEEVRFFAEVFSTDEPRVGLKKKPIGLPEISSRSSRRESSTPWPRSLLKVGSFAAAACLVAMLAWNYFEPEGIGSVVAIEGQATIRRFGARSDIGLGEGDRVFEGDLIRTDDNSRLCLRLEGSNLVHLNETTEVRLEAMRLLHHNMGETWFEIAKGKGEFEVETRGADVVVLGTSFGVKYENEEVFVPVSSGRVRLLSKGGEIDLEPGHIGTYSSSKPYLPPSRKTELFSDSQPGWLLAVSEDVRR